MESRESGVGSGGSGLRIAGWIVLLGVALAPGCGRKGMPHPPLPQRPAGVSDLAVRQEGNLAVISFSLPAAGTDGRALAELPSVEIWRMEGAPVALLAARPAAARVTGAPTPEDAGTTLEQQAERLEFEAAATLVERLDAAALRRAIYGPRYVWSEVLPERLRAEELPRRRLTYAVYLKSGRGRSDPSNLALLDPRPIRTAPEVADVRVGENRVELVVLPRDADPTRRDVESPSGSVVFRRRDGEDAPLEPIGAPLLDPEIRFVDAGVPEGRYWYRAAALLAAASFRGPRGDEICVDVVDAFPPPVPGTAEVFREEAKATLYWEPVVSPDISGYVVERGRCDGSFAPVSGPPFAETRWSDSAIRPEDRFCYRIRSVDRAGNRSAPSPTAEAPPF